VGFTIGSREVPGQEKPMKRIVVVVDRHIDGRMGHTHGMPIIKDICQMLTLIINRK
jgi:hypothetical protein